MIISMIAAVSEDWLIGRDNKIPWHYSEDLKRFKRLTMGHPIVMGRNTFESLKKPLEGRENVVISNTLKPQKGITLYRSTEEALRKLCYNKEVFIIGGEQIYSSFMEEAHRIYLTKIPIDYGNACYEEGDVFFPFEIFDYYNWSLLEETKHKESGLKFQEYIKTT